jgi:quercetin dioxygenase-like cupin family protein
MCRSFLALVIGLGIGIGQSNAQHDHVDGESVKIIGMHEIVEKFDGKDSAVSFVEVTIEPGQSGLAHRHPGPGFVYVLEGEYELGMDDQPTKIFKAGETFYEPAGRLHRVSRNPAKTGKTRLIAVVVHPRDAKEVAISEPAATAEKH